MNTQRGVGAVVEQSAQSEREARIAELRRRLAEVGPNGSGRAGAGNRPQQASGSTLEANSGVISLAPRQVRPSEPAANAGRGGDPRRMGDPPRAQSLRDPSAEVLRVPASLAEQLPRGGLPRGMVATATGARSLVVELLAAATARGGYAGVVGLRHLGLLRVIELGGRLDRIAHVPDSGGDPVAVAGVLLDGMDLVIVDLAGVHASPTQTRAVIARARSKGAVLIAVDGDFAGAQLHLRARVREYRGLGVTSGRGRIGGIEIEYEARGKGVRPRPAAVPAPIAVGSW